MMRPASMAGSRCAIWMAWQTASAASRWRCARLRRNVVWPRYSSFCPICSSCATPWMAPATRAKEKAPCGCTRASCSGTVRSRCARMRRLFFPHAIFGHRKCCQADPLYVIRCGGAAARSERAGGSMAKEALMRANCRQGRLTITDGELFVAPRVPVVSRPRWSAARGEIAGLSVCPGHGVTLGLAFRTQDGRELHADWLLPHDAQPAAAILGYHYSLHELRELAAEMALGGEADVELIALAPADVEPAPAIRIVANSGPPQPAAPPAVPPPRTHAQARPSHVAVLLAGAAAVLAIASIALLRLLTALLAGISALIERATPATYALRRQTARLAPILAPAESALRRAALHWNATLEPIRLAAARAVARARPTLRLPRMGRRRVAGVGLALACLFSLIVAAAFGSGAHVPPAKPSPHNELTQLLPHILPTPAATATALPTATPVPTRVPTPTPMPTPTPRPQPTPAPPPAALTLAI